MTVSLSHVVERVPKVIKFGVVGGSGIFVNTAALAAVGEIGGFHYMIGVIVATQISSTWNFLWSEMWVFRASKSNRALNWRYLMFLGTNNVALFLRGPIIFGLTEWIGVHYLLSNFMSLVVLFALRFSVADRLIWRESLDQAPVDP